LSLSSTLIRPVAKNRDIITFVNNLMKEIFITGGTGYMGTRLIPLLLARGYSVKSLVRKGSENKVPPGCDHVIADPFDASGFQDQISPGSTFIQLLGVSHPSPKKKEQFKSIDLRSVKASAIAAKHAGVAHFIYISVAQLPTKVMRDYQQCRAEGEQSILSTNIPATFIRPWYVTGPGHYWPLAFLPLFKILEWIPSTSLKAKALRLVSIGQMLKTLLYSVENRPKEKPDIIEINRILKME
jgi:uncharacterized protein YbjT (DUF2867 family)